MRNVLLFFRIRGVLATGLFTLVFLVNRKGRYYCFGKHPVGRQCKAIPIDGAGAFFYSEGNLARRPGVKAIALDVLPENSAHAINHLNDGIYGNGSSWIGNSADSWAGLDLGARTRLTAFAFGRNNTSRWAPQTGIPSDYRIQYTQSSRVGAGSSWTDIGVISYNGSDLSLSRRHLFTLRQTVEATGFRIICPSGACIDEIELYDTTPAGLRSPWLTGGRFGEALSMGNRRTLPHWGRGLA